ncbi:1-deoxy-D-xylulose-5-phosphate synthase [Lachnospiraceae bacterium C7]|nr:1-deoxy-D-xylulose-5-phosphate synthase [Lachnospiraceae bacterium C7]
MYEILKKITGPKDIKALNIQQLEQLAKDIRDALMNRLTKVGGHFGPNFGMVEAEIAMHYVFDSPRDKFVFDVSHQAYPHKMLTGRAQAYMDDVHFGDVSGYTNPEENEHDFFNVGHTSTSISLAAGLAEGRNLTGGNENIVAVIGDGSLSGGEALEALDYAGSELKGNFIIVVNDNQQSIAEVHGGLYKNLDELRKTNGQATNNMFKAIGLDYIYEANGNNIEKMIQVFKKVKDIDHPIVVHINTKKGLGYKLAEDNKESWHWSSPFDEKTGKPKVDLSDIETYTSLTAQYILERTKKDKKFITITPAMPGTAGLTIEMRKKLGQQYKDVGIAEEHAIALASGIAKNGGRPLVVTNSTFLQRTYDQVSQDVCINNNPITVVVNFSSVRGLTDVTHLGIFTHSIFGNIPNLVMLAPTNKAEYIAMLDWSLEQQEHPVFILIPGNGVHDDERVADINYSQINKYKVEQQGSEVAIIAAGGFYQLGEAVAEEIKNEKGITPTLINPRFVSGIDTDLLTKLKNNHKSIITLEDGIVEGGFGQKIASFYGADSNIKVRNYGLEKEFYDRYDPEELLENLGITPEKIVKDILK